MIHCSAPREKQCLPAILYHLIHERTMLVHSNNPSMLSIKAFIKQYCSSFLYQPMSSLSDKNRRLTPGFSSSYPAIFTVCSRQVFFHADFGSDVGKLVRPYCLGARSSHWYQPHCSEMHGGRDTIFSIEGAAKIILFPNELSSSFFSCHELRLI